MLAAVIVKGSENQTEMKSKLAITVKTAFMKFLLAILYYYYLLSTEVSLTPDIYPSLSFLFCFNTCTVNFKNLNLCPFATYQ